MIKCECTTEERIIDGMRGVHIVQCPVCKAAPAMRDLMGSLAALVPFRKEYPRTAVRMDLLIARADGCETEDAVRG